MFFDIVRSAIHQLTAPPKEKVEPAPPSAKPSKPEGAASAKPEAPKFVNPYDSTSRYRHLKEADGSWKKVSDDKDWTPWQPPALDASIEKEREREKVLYEYALKDVLEVEKDAAKTPPAHSLDTWNAAWREVNKLSPANALALQDRLLILHPQWTRVETVFERARPDRRGYEEINQATTYGALADMKEAAIRLINQGGLTQFPHFSKKLGWYERRLEDADKTKEKLSMLREFIGEINPAQSPENDVAKQVREEEQSAYHAQVIRLSAKDKNKGRAQDLMRTQYARLQKELQETSFLIERELATTLPRQQIGEAMQQVREGTYRVGVVTRARDWLSSRLGGLAGHQNAHSLHELVEKHRSMSQTMEKIKRDLNPKER